MKNNDETFVPMWEKTLEKGKLNFVLKFGVLWAFSLFFFTELFNYFAKINETPMTFEKYLFKFFFYLVGTVLLSLILWYFQNKKYQKMKNLVH